MRCVKNLDRGDCFFQLYNFVHNFFRKCRLKQILNHLGLKLDLGGPAKLFYMARDF